MGSLFDAELGVKRHADPKWARDAGDRGASDPVKSAFKLVLVLVVASAVYANALSVPFILDDRLHIERSSAIRPPFTTAKFLSSGRPLVTVSLALNYALGGLDVTGYHVFNVLLHLACGLVVFGFTRYTITRLTSSPRYEDEAANIALCAMAVFLLHPIQTESVTYISQRAEILAAMLLIGAVWYAAIVVDRLKSVHPPARDVAVLACIGIAGCLSKESFFVLPALFWLYDWCFLSRGRAQAMLQRWRLYLVLLVVGTASLAWGIRGALDSEMGGFSVSGHGTDEITPWRYLLSQFGVLVYYGRLILYPNQLCFDCGYMAPWPVIHSWLGNRVVLPAMVVASTAVLAFAARRWSPMVTFALIGSAIALAPTSSIVPLADTYFEHRLYLPLALLSMLFSAATARAAQELAAASGLSRSTIRWGWTGVMMLICATLAVLSVMRNDIYTDRIVLYEDTIRKAPESRRAQFALGIWYSERGELERAAKHFRETISLNPRVARGYVNLGVTYVKLRRYEDAAMAFEAARDREPGLELAHKNLTVACRLSGRTADAIDAAEHYVATHPGSAAAYKLLAELYESTGRTVDALHAYEAAGRLHPADRTVERKVAALRQRSNSN